VQARAQRELKNYHGAIANLEKALQISATVGDSAGAVPSIITTGLLQITIVLCKSVNTDNDERVHLLGQNMMQYGTQLS
jgi:hypothetical protein